MEGKVITTSKAETAKLGEMFAKELKGGDIVALSGDLGSGKTTFVQGLAQGLGIKKRIISPTFIIVRKYESRIRNFYHIDLYRTEGEKDIEGLGIEEIINDPHSIVAIEWAEKIGELLQKKRWEVRFEYEYEKSRKIQIRRISG